MSLAQLQSRVTAAILAAESSDIAPLDGRAPERGLRVYIDAYRLRLIESLATDFPGLQALTGVDTFGELARTYVEQHRSRHYSLRNYGQGLPSFLRTAMPWAARIEWAEMAVFEWCMSEVFDAADEESLQPEALAQLPSADWGECFLQPAPTFRILPLHTNVPALWKCQQATEALPDVIKTEDATLWLVWRHQMTVYYRALEADEVWALDAMRGASLADLCAGLCRWHDPGQVPARAAALLRRWVDESLISGLRCGQ